MIHKAVLAALVAAVPLASAAQGNAEAARNKVSMCIGCHGIPGYKASFPLVYSVPMIAGHDSTAFRNLSPGSPNAGSKLVCFNERFARPTVFEVPFGLSVRELCERVAGGMRDGRSLKAVQIGGPLGGILPAARPATAFDFDEAEGETERLANDASERD